MKLLFIINTKAGRNNSNYRAEIEEYFTGKSHEVDFLELAEKVKYYDLKEKIKEYQPERVIAVGGDGTVKLVAEALEGGQISLGIIPGGSANGMAKELGIPIKIEAALDTIIDGKPMQIHLLRVNKELCIHLSDIGFNAYVVKKFHSGKKRGMWSYIKAAWKVLLNYPVMRVKLQIDGKVIQRPAAMVVIANGTQYGTGVRINPEGTLTDDLFEIVVVKKVSFNEIFKMRVTHGPYHPAKTEIFQCRSVKIESRHAAHFQVDGEYRGRVREVEAEVKERALKVIVPITL